MQSTDDLMKPDEEWRDLGDPSERRKIQNRLAQRAYRRNMRERAAKIDQLTEQLKAYEDMHMSQTEDNPSNQQESSSSILPPDKRGTGSWGPSQQSAVPVAPNDEWYNLSLRNDFETSRVQQHTNNDSRERHVINSPRPPTRQRTQYSALDNHQRLPTGPLTPTPSLPMEGAFRSETMLPLNLVDMSANTYENFPFDLPETVLKTPPSTSLLHIAVAGNHLETVKVLLQDERVMLDDKDCEGFTPLQRAVMNGRTEIVKLLLEHLGGHQKI